jgi:lipoprotein-anchoring transpeptidase ErfK/SrfK
VFSPRSRTRCVVAIAALLPLTLLSAGCGDSDASTAASTSPTTAPGPTTTSAGPTTTTTVPDPAYRSWIANVRSDVHSVVVHDSPGGAELQLDTSGRGPLKTVAIGNPLPSGAPTTFRVKQRNVVAAGATWHEVYLPVRPNGSTGWIAADDVTLTTTDMSAVINLTTHQLQLSNAGAVIATYPVASGHAPDTPTPTGDFYIKELVQPSSPTGAYGPLAYGLSAFSPTLVDTDAFADGVIGIHGTNEPKLIGQSVSHGCLRVNNNDVLDLQKRQVPLGMPVTITA